MCLWLCVAVSSWSRCLETSNLPTTTFWRRKENLLRSHHHSLVSWHESCRVSVSAASSDMSHVNAVAYSPNLVTAIRQDFEKNWQKCLLIHLFTIMFRNCVTKLTAEVTLVQLRPFAIICKILLVDWNVSKPTKIALTRCGDWCEGVL